LGAGVGEGESFIRTEAQRRRIDPEVAVTVANMEGGVDAPGLVGKFDTGWSFWPYQLHYGGAGYEQFGTVAGMGNSFTALTGWQPGDPEAWQDSVRYALDHAKTYGWGAWYGAAKAGIVGMRGIDVNYPWSVTPADEWDYKKRGQAVLPYNPDAPIDRQVQDWTCSIESAQWLLRSIGRNPDASNPQSDPWLHSQLVPGIVSPAVGLLKGDGSDLAAWLTREYGAEGGWVAQFSPVTFDDVAAGAGFNPTIMGGARFGPGGHWIGVRRLLPNGSLEIANPAPGFDGVTTTLTREQWDARGPWNAIWIDRLSALPSEPPSPPVDTRLARARALLVQAIAVLDEPA
jgi:hypothetical protein